MKMSENIQSFFEMIEYAAENRIVVGHYQGSHEARIEIAAGNGPLPEDIR